MIQILKFFNKHLTEESEYVLPYIYSLSSLSNNATELHFFYLRILLIGFQVGILYSYIIMSKMALKQRNLLI